MIFRQTLPSWIGGTCRHKNVLWLGLSRSAFLISDAINILFFSYPSTMRVGREVIIIIILWKLTLHCMFDCEGEMF